MSRLSDGIAVRESGKACSMAAGVSASKAGAPAVESHARAASNTEPMRHVAPLALTPARPRGGEGQSSTLPEPVGDITRATLFVIPSVTPIPPALTPAASLVYSADPVGCRRDAIFRWE